ncbi:DUF4468 domain-containing protein [Runella sp. SP2]|uniref:DUF4468 domain-containing protein n=1 Tax=Runella sp. SP2 TaxID=2268026 RepID=UPI000F08384F|nr:DUF4468 domain-containing protein [Runella sp. SP2]AYQ31350.1 DUF4468 domain-containing protein [Runella sp. SP2]
MKNTILITNKIKLFTCWLVVNLGGIVHSLAQDKYYGIMPVSEEKVVYEEVVLVDSSSQVNLRKKAKIWFIDSYKSSKDVISLDEDDEIIGKGFFKTIMQGGFMNSYPVDVQHTISVQFKDGRYRYKISNIQLNYQVVITQNTPPRDVSVPLEKWVNGSQKNVEKRFLIKLDEQIKLIIDSLKTGMKKTEKKDW